MKRRNLLIVCAAIGCVAALLFWYFSPYRVVGTITIVGPDAKVLARPVPIEHDPSNPVLRNLKPGDRLDVYDRVYGKDYLMYEVHPSGTVGYVMYHGTRLRFESPSGEDH
jgi:hypothetical protein